MKTSFLCSLLLITFLSNAQTITGVWKGKIKSTRVELKLIKSGDSITGTSYYYDSKNNYQRYAVKGYFDNETNYVIWWDDALIKQTSGNSSSLHNALLSVADFNCPGEDEMLLDGKASLRDNKEVEKGDVHLQKINTPVFKDEWDFVIENYTAGANDPYIIDSIARLAFDNTQTNTVPTKVITKNNTVITKKQPEVVIDVSHPEEEKKLKPAAPQPVEEKFTLRKKTLATVIPVSADSIELRFYDNAEIDGDSIALFLNNRLVFKHIRLTEKAYTIKFAANELEEDNELVMVAENLGSIPPNTSLMVAIAGDKRYEARLQSTENSSALIRLVKSPR